MAKRNLTEQQRKNARAIKSDYKRVGLYILVVFPVIIATTILFTILNWPLWVMIFTNVVLGLAFCFIVYVISDKIKQKKIEKQKREPKKIDPFAD